MSRSLVKQGAQCGPGARARWEVILVGGRRSACPMLACTAALCLALAAPFSPLNAAANDQGTPRLAEWKKWCAANSPRFHAEWVHHELIALVARGMRQSSELLAITYGALVAQLVEDYEDPAAINEQLEKMGYNIGMRIIEEFLAKTAELPLWSKTPCADFREAMDVVAKVGFKMFLGISTDTRWISDTEVVLVFKDDLPLNEFVELPDTLSALNYSNIVCGVVRGSLEMVQFKVQCRFGSDTLQGADVSEMHVVLTEVLAEMPPNDED